MEESPPAASASEGAATSDEKAQEKAQEKKPRRRWRVPQWTGFGRKTLWDWLQLLIVPAILVAGTFVWSATQTRSDNRRDDRRFRDATLQAYLDQMSRLMLDKKLLTSKASDAVRPVARSLTLTTLRRLDGERKAAVLRFLYEARLIDRKTAVVSLKEADFRGAELTDAVLGGANLEGANLAGAKLVRCDLGRANLDSTNLRGANLAAAFLNRATVEIADLQDAILRDASLDRTSLSYSDLTGANFLRADLDSARLEGADLTGADLTNASLEIASLDSARLEGADLRSANLRSADLRSAFLSDADFEGADLTGATLGDRKGADRHLAKDLNLDALIADLRDGPHLAGPAKAPFGGRRPFLDSQRAFLDSLSPVQLSKFNLSAEKLARFRREASDG